MELTYEIYLMLSRWILPALSLVLAVAWLLRFRAVRPREQILARLETADGLFLPIHHGEGYIGRKRWCDVHLPLASISGKHAMFYLENGQWFIAPLKGEVWVRNRPIKEPTRVMDGDSVILAGEELFFCYGPPESEETYREEQPTGSGFMLFVLSVFQLVMMGQLCLRYMENLPLMLPVCFGVLIAGEWLYYFACRFMNSRCMLAEVPVLYLLTLGLAVCACSAPEALVKQLACALMGTVGFILLTLFMKNQSLCYRLRYVIASITVAVLWFTVLFGTEIYGSRNWLSIGGAVTVQPSEFAKVAFLLVGGCSLYVADRQKTNRYFFLSFAALIMAALVLMVDFGAIAIFFVTMLVILLMRLASVWLVGGIAGGAVAIGGLVLLVYPHVAQRFGAWMHVWEYASTTGYQQTRTMIAAASGGMLGLGGGNGTLLGVAAADTDLVFGVLCEEWGGIVALCAALCFVALGVYARRLAAGTSSAFYTIGVCGAATMMLFQTALNIFGSTDILPLTGVTMMFVSRGGTSLVAAFLMIAFFKAAEGSPDPPMAERRDWE